MKEFIAAFVIENQVVFGGMLVAVLVYRAVESQDTRFKSLILATIFLIAASLIAILISKGSIDKRNFLLVYFVGAVMIYFIPLNQNAIEEKLPFLVKKKSQKK